MLEITLAIALALSLAGNAILALKIKKQSRQETYDCKELLQDLLSGTALVAIRRIAAADVLIRAPRGQ